MDAFLLSHGVHIAQSHGNYLDLLPWLGGVVD